ncbi:hypothetical protein FXN98_19510 [Klebsiella pneumoniae]|nr:hypothetical protein FXN98_19510 [Klebsiella pneumoniae]
MPENPASYRVVRTKSYLFNKAAPLFKPSPAPAGGSGSGPLTLHPSVVFTRWRERSIRRSAEPDDSHYSKFL